MKLSKGRGIQFFKRPFVVQTQKYAGELVKASQETFSSALKYLSKGKTKEKK